VNATHRLALAVTIVLLTLLLPWAARAQLPAPGQPGAPADPRYCGEPRRTAEGRIHRDRAVLREFAKTHPCPSTLEPRPSCPGWAIDHVIPLASGGCDSLINLQWLPDSLKSCAGDCKDRWERRYHGTPRQTINLED